MNDCIGIIYMLTNRKNLKSYIGQTRSYGIRNGKRVNIGLKGRWKQHCWKAKKLQDDCPALSRAIRKYGPENFIVEEIYNCSLDKLNDAEAYFILLHDTHIKGYNCTMGGDHPSANAEQRQEMNRKISEKNKAHWAVRDRVAMSKILSSSTQDAMWRPEVRAALMNGVKRMTNLPENIYERKIKGVLVGYEVKIRIKSILHRGWFSSKKIPLEENFEKALSYLNDIKRKNL